jgi:hypothetical protein
MILESEFLQGVGFDLISHDPGKLRRFGKGILKGTIITDIPERLHKATPLFSACLTHAHAEKMVSKLSTVQVKYRARARFSSTNGSRRRRVAVEPLRPMGQLAVVVFHRLSPRDSHSPF